MASLAALFALGMGPAAAPARAALAQGATVTAPYDAGLEEGDAGLAAPTADSRRVSGCGAGLVPVLRGHHRAPPWGPAAYSPWEMSDVSIKFEKVKAGDTLYDVHRHKLGNTTMSELGLWTVKIITVDERGAHVSWNGNRAEWWPKTKVSKLYAKPPPSYLEQQRKRAR